MNDGAGNLGGQAWSEGLGYIGFAGVTIDSTGRFRSQASGTLPGIISFECSNCGVQIDCRPASLRGGGSVTVGGGGGGGGGGSAPSFGVEINGNAAYTTSTDVTLTFFGLASRIMISNYFDFHDAVEEPFVAAKRWNVCSECGVVSNRECIRSEYVVYVKFYDSSGFRALASDMILYSRPSAGLLPLLPATIQKIVAPLFPAAHFQ